MHAAGPHHLDAALHAVGCVRRVAFRLLLPHELPSELAGRRQLRCCFVGVVMLAKPGIDQDQGVGSLEVEQAPTTTVAQVGVGALPELSQLVDALLVGGGALVLLQLIEVGQQLPSLPDH